MQVVLPVSSTPEESSIASPALPVGKILRTAAARCFQEPLSSWKRTGGWKQPVWHWQPDRRTEKGWWNAFPEAFAGSSTEKDIFWLKAQGPHNYRSLSLTHACCRNSISFLKSYRQEETKRMGNRWGALNECSLAPYFLFCMEWI